MTIKLISQDVTKLRQAYQTRKREYEVLRTAGEFSGAVLHAGVLLELALKIAICKQLDVAHLPRTFQVHDLEYLLYCSGFHRAIMNDPDLIGNFKLIVTKWSMELRYEGAIISQQDADECHQALFNQTDGLLVFLSTII
jgi:hypothetical protein